MVSFQRIAHSVQYTTEQWSAQRASNGPPWCVCSRHIGFKQELERSEQIKVALFSHSQHFVPVAIIDDEPSIAKSKLSNEFSTSISFESFDFPDTERRRASDDRKLTLSAFLLFLLLVLLLFFMT